MIKRNGFTLIKLFIVLAIIGIIASIMLGVYHRFKNNSNVIITTTGKMIEKICIEGLLFVTDGSANTIQVIDENGKGKRCTMEQPITEKKEKNNL